MVIAAIVQARMKGTRLPDKVLLPLGGKPMLQHVVDRLGRCRLVDTVVVATTDDGSETPIVKLCERLSVRCFRGSVEDVLARYVGAARDVEADIVVRVTADCPLVDPVVVDQAIAALQERGVDYVSTGYGGKSYPHGLDLEVVRMSALERAFTEARNPFEREHVTPYIHRNPQLFKLSGISLTKDYSHVRVTVDEPDDVAVLRSILEMNPEIGLSELIALADACPEVFESNMGAAQRWKTNRERMFKDGMQDI